MRNTVPLRYISALIKAQGTVTKVYILKNYNGSCHWELLMNDVNNYEAIMKSLFFLKISRY